MDYYWLLLKLLGLNYLVTIVVTIIFMGITSLGGGNTKARGMLILAQFVANIFFAAIVARWMMS